MNGITMNSDSVVVFAVRTARHVHMTPSKTWHPHVQTCVKYLNSAVSCFRRSLRTNLGIWFWGILQSCSSRNFSNHASFNPLHFGPFSHLIRSWTAFKTCCITPPDLDCFSSSMLSVMLPSSSSSTSYSSRPSSLSSSMSSVATTFLVLCISPHCYQLWSLHLHFE